MKKVKAFITTISIFLTLTLSGQNKTFIGINASLTTDYYKIEDEGDRIHPGHTNAGSFGFALTQEMNHHLSLETGLILKLYQSGFGINGFPEFYNSKDAIDCWQIPLRVNARFNLSSDILFLKTTLGYHFCFNNSYFSSSGSGGTTFINNQPVFSYDETSNYSLTKTYSLLEGGLGLEVVLSGKSMLTFSVNYFTGFQKIIQSDITYQVVQGPPINATMYSNGNYLGYTVGFSYPISTIWQKRRA